MLELDAASFVGSTVRLRSLILFNDKIENKNGRLSDADKSFLISEIGLLIVEVEKIGARSAFISAWRLKENLDNNDDVTHEQFGYCIKDIESRIVDHLQDIRLFVLQQNEVMLMAPVEQLLAFDGKPVEDFSMAFPKASFEIEEAAKCCALNRHTASVFHCMRALECGIRALSKFLGIPDPVKPAEKNWGKILESLNNAIDTKWPKHTRIGNTIGDRMSALFATLDAVKNPWRNATMHVETIYAPHEAIHIARCTGMFLLDLAKYFDEEGRIASEAPAMVHIDSPNHQKI